MNCSPDDFMHDFKRSLEKPKLLPIIRNKIKACKRIVKRHSAEEIDGILVDVQSANAIVTVYKYIGKRNKSKFIDMPIQRMSDISWRLLDTLGGI